MLSEKTKDNEILSNISRKSLAFPHFAWYTDLIGQEFAHSKMKER